MSGSLQAKRADLGYLPMGRDRAPERLLWFGAAVLLFLMFPTFAAWWIDARSINGISIWTKPLKFQFSFAVHLITVAVVVRSLPPVVLSGWILRSLVASIVAVAMLEVSYIGWQAAQAEASHFNLTTSFTRLMYSLMGVGAVAVMLATATLGAMALRYAPASDLVHFGGAVGLILGSLLGWLTGSYMAAQPGHWVGGELTDAGGLPIVGWSQSGGDLRVAHFFATHAMHFIPAAGLIASMALAPAPARMAVYAASFAYVALVGYTFMQALAGQPFLAFL
jgi:hypothetical protein